ncbi:p21-activated protein kinase-interacting protein 1 isoform X2 [Microcaecilia unicolor]|uniref:P21-activated protein kinase-interacting protein 1 isoform X2 n=1 Tax=Microcaecilia unicolor TaxID=1415580 RepID=A0A6P7YBR3_9AMPH|nr:p21-activated protein kinase-interacting protein 1 isoform X2 [Microcaecilia unicolor]
MEVVTGCYEQVLFGYRLRRDHEVWTLSADFTHHAHTGSLSAVAVSNRYIATGSKDETIQLYDMKKKTEHGALLHHDGTITCLEFHSNTHLLSGAEDGLICVWNVKKWECQKSIKAHRGHVTSLSVHPSGKLALSVGTDKTLRTWNLIEGRSAFIKNFKQNAHIVKWSPSGQKYIVVVMNQLDIYSLETASVIGTISHGKRISSVQFITDTLLAVAGDEEVVRLYDCDSQKCLNEFRAHENRIKSIYTFGLEDFHVVMSASNDGYIRAWRLDQDKVQEPPSLLCEVNTSARLTCLSVWRADSSETKNNPDTAVEESLTPTKSKKKIHWSKTDTTEEGGADSNQLPLKKKKKLQTTVEKKKKKCP